MRYKIESSNLGLPVRTEVDVENNGSEEIRIYNREMCKLIVTLSPYEVSFSMEGEECTFRITGFYKVDNPMIDQATVYSKAVIWLT